MLCGKFKEPVIFFFHLITAKTAVLLLYVSSAFFQSQDPIEWKTEPNKLRTVNKQGNLGKWSFALWRSYEQDTASCFLFFFFPSTGSSLPLTCVRGERREARDTIILPFFHQRKIDLRAERKSLERGHLTCLTTLSCSNFQWEANGLGGGPSGCTHYSRVSAARAEAGL